MTSIQRTLRESDPALLPVFAQFWGVKIDAYNREAQIEAIREAMLDPGRADRVWEGLDDKQRGAMHALLGVKEAKMPEMFFTQLYGKIPEVSAAQIEKKKPHLKPSSITEALYYRGLISIGYENDPRGARRIIYVPSDMIGALPSHRTSYDKLEDADDDLTIDAVTGEREQVTVEPLDEVSNVRQADTSIVDDMATLLAYLRLHVPLLSNDFLAQGDADGLSPFLLNHLPQRFVFLLRLGISADLIEVQAGKASPRRAEARTWLELPRAAQVKRLAEAWRDGLAYVDLWHVPGLNVEREAGTMSQYNPAAVRTVVMEIMGRAVPKEAWWSLDDFIFMMREDSSDFQRPNGDFESWYIRSEAGDYLTGLQSWDAVEGALLEFYITGPMHWLGLMDLADDAARLTAYGRAFLNMGAWPNPPETGDKVEVQPDGTLLISRKLSRYDRFQVSRFTTWVSPAEGSTKPYVYRLDTQGIRRGGEQGIGVANIATFITRMAGDQPLPPPVASLLEKWKGGAKATVNFERVLILRTNSQDVMDAIWSNPGLVRFLGARLGSKDAIIRAENWEAFRDALGEQGIAVEWVGE
jgi:hypothetical protein